MKKPLLLLVALLVFAACSSVFGQISKEGTPPSTTFALDAVKSVKDFTPNFDWSKIAEEDNQAQKQGKPLRAGKSIPVGIDINSSGEWNQLPNGNMVWRLKLKSDGATSLGVVFDQYELPEGSELYLYNEDKSMVIGAFGNHNNNDYKVFSTHILNGSVIVIEYTEKPNVLHSSTQKQTVDNGVLKKFQPVDTELYKTSALLQIGELMYVYTEGLSYSEDEGKPEPGSSDPCEVDINCSVGSGWVNQKRGVAHIVFREGADWYYCSGTLINNTAKDGKPYFLTANHCGGDASASDRLVWQFYFNFERPSCGSGTAPTSNMITGCVLRSTGSITGGSDFQLVEFNSQVPIGYNPYYNGWDRSTTGATSGASIHHPSGDVKKISTFSTQLTTSNGLTGMATGSAWRVVWSSNISGWGVTEGGSSGSPIFNESGRQVGTLSGGSSFCNAQTAPDDYGKFSYHWDNAANGTTDDKKLKPWLDPLGTNPTFLSGWDPAVSEAPPVANFSANATSGYSGAEIIFTDLSTNGPYQWSWNFGTNAFPQTSTERNPRVVWVTPGTYNISLTATNALGSHTVTKNGYITITAAPAPPATNPKIIGTGTSTSLYPLGANTKNVGAAKYVRSASIFTPTEVGGGGLITKLEWFIGTSRSDVRQIQVYLKHTTLSVFTATTVNEQISGATLVYSSSFKPSATGWFGFNTGNFIYNNSDNLMVIVLAETELAASGGGTDATSNCNYTATTGFNRHQNWNGNTVPTGTGTVNVNRPNIRITFASNAAPVTDFVANVPTIIMQQGFDGTWLPDGWTVVNTHATNRWQQGNPSGTPYTTIDPDNINSAIVPWIAQNQDEWLISPEISTAEYSGRPMKIKFHAGFSRSWLSPGATMSFKISTDNGTTWTQLWNAIGDATLPSGTAWAWRLIDINLASYAGQNVKFAWQYVGNDGDLMGLDGVKLYLNEFPSSFNIFEGETLSFLDQSTNNPIVWNWQFTGSTTPTVYTQNPTVRYNVAGTYNVSLTAGNPGGTNLKTKTGYVIVNGRAPIANFGFKSNLRTEYNQAFIPKGGTVEYIDLSTRVPTSWSWTINGGNPPSSSNQNQTVTYSSVGLYSTSLSVSNASGSDAIAGTDLVKVGGAAFATNVYPNDISTVYTDENGFLPGHSSYVYESKTYYTYQWAEFFSNSYSGTIEKVQVYVKYAQGVGKNVIITVWDGGAGKPGTVLGSKTVPITSFTENPSLNTITFDAPIPVTRNFFIGYQLTYDASHNYTTHQFCPYMSRSREGMATLWVKEGTTTADAAWFDFSAYGIYSSIWIEPEFSYPSAVASGDVNEDASLNVLDVVWLISHLNGSTPTGFNLTAANVNGTGGVDIADLTALIALIMNGAKDNQEDINSEPGKIYLDSDGLITFESDGTLTALQFQLTPGIEETGITLLIDTDHKLSFNSETGRGVIYSMNNTPFAAGKIDLMQVENVDLTTLQWGNVVAANINNQTVEVVSSKFGITSTTDIANNFDFIVYPNPNSGSFAARVNLPINMQIELQLIDVLGRIVSMSPKTIREQGENVIEFNSNNRLNGGVYILRVNGYDTNGNTLLIKHEEKLMIIGR